MRKQVGLTETKSRIILIILYCFEMCAIFIPYIVNRKLGLESSFESVIAYLMSLIIFGSYCMRWSRTKEVCIPSVCITFTGIAIISQPNVSYACLVGGIIFLLYIIMYAAKQMNTSALEAVLYSTILFTVYEICVFGMEFTPYQYPEVLPYFIVGVFSAIWIGAAWKMEKICRKNKEMEWDKFSAELMAELEKTDYSEEKPSEEMLQAYQKWKECAATRKEQLTKCSSGEAEHEKAEEETGTIASLLQEYEGLIKKEVQAEHWENAEKIFDCYMEVLDTCKEKNDSLNRGALYLNAACLAKEIERPDFIKYGEKGLDILLEEMQGMMVGEEEENMPVCGDMLARKMLAWIQKQEEKLEFILEEKKDE